MLRVFLATGCYYFKPSIIGSHSIAMVIPQITFSILESDTLGKRVLESDILGKRVLESDTLGKRVLERD